MSKQSDLREAIVRRAWVEYDRATDRLVRNAEFALYERAAYTSGREDVLVAGLALRAIETLLVGRR